MRKSFRKGSLAAGFLLSWMGTGQPAFSATIYLKSGASIGGKIIQEDADSVTIKSGSEKTRVPLDEILQIDYFNSNLAPARQAQPQTAPEEQTGRGEFEVMFDYFLPTNVVKETDNEAQSFYNSAISAGYFPVSSVQTPGAFGGRIGYFYRVSQDRNKSGISFGLSAGYLSGPNATASVSAVNGFTGGIITDKKVFSFWRMMATSKLDFPNKEGKTLFSLGAGGGLAIGNSSENASCLGTACTTQFTETGSGEWNGFSWELSAQVPFDHLVMGFLWDAFPSFKGVMGSLGDTGFAAFPYWHTWEVTAGYRF